MQKQQLAMQIEQLKKDREVSERRYIEMANAHEEARKQEKESKAHEKIEAQRIAEELATALALEKDKEDAENAEKRKEEETRLREAEEAEVKSSQVNTILLQTPI